MVEQNYILYVNSKKVLRQAPISLTLGVKNHRLKFSIPEDHLICGLILNGIPIKGNLLQNFPFKPIEKFMFEISNIHFTIPDMEYTVENTSYNFELTINS